MLKTLRITSLIITALAVCGVVMIVVFGLKGNPEIQAFLQSPGITDSIKDKIASQPQKEDAVSPLVAQAKKFALLIDPPPPPPPPKPKEAVKPPAELARTEPVKPTIPTPKVQTSAKFDLLATVVYETAPEKSLALLKTTGGKEEWFRQGEKVGHLDIQQVKNGSVVFTQGGKNPQEQFVPVKSEPKSLLKKDQQISASLPVGSSSVAVQLPSSGQDQVFQTEADQSDQAASGIETADSAADRLIRPSDRTSRSRPDVAERIMRIRSIPAPPPPEEQKASLETTLSRIDEIMGRQDESISEEQRQNESDMWNRLLEQLHAEKEKLDTLTASDDSGTPTDETEAEASGPSADQNSRDGDKPAPADPNRP